MDAFLGLVICLSVLLFYFFAGRIIATHTLFGRNYASAGLHNIFTALGVWYFIALIATVFEIQLNYAWWGFVSIIVVLYFYLLSSSNDKLPQEHTLTSPLSILLFLAPTFYFVINDVPTQIQELIGYMRNAQYTASNLTAVTVADSKAYALQNITDPPAALFSLLPVYIFKTSFFASSFTIFNALLLAFVADTMTKLTNLKISWSNLTLVSAGSIFALTVLNPYFSLESLTSAMPNFIFSAGLLTAIIPLCREKQLPIGLSAIPAALVLSVLVGIHEMGAYAVGFILCLWLVRTLFEEFKLIDLLFSLTILVALPVLSWHLWAFHAQNIEFEQISTYFNSADVVYIAKNTLSPLQLLAFTAVLILLLIEVISIRKYADFKALFIRNGWLTIPTIFICAYSFVSILLNENSFVTHIQFIAVVPFWYIATSWYKNSKWCKFAYESPWVLALSLAVVFMSLQSIASGTLTQRLSDPAQHTLNVSKLLQKNILIEQDDIAVLESTHKNNLYTSFMRYGLTNHKGKVVNVNKTLTRSSYDIDIFRQKLRDNNFDYLWIHSPTTDDKKWLGRFLKSDKSYLFKVTNNKLRLIRVYPHPSYDFKDL